MYRNKKEPAMALFCFLLCFFDFFYAKGIKHYVYTRNVLWALKIHDILFEEEQKRANIPHVCLNCGASHAAVESMIKKEREELLEMVLENKTEFSQYFDFDKSTFGYQKSYFEKLPILEQITQTFKFLSNKSLSKLLNQ